MDIQIPNVDHVLNGVYISGVRYAGRVIPALQEARITRVLKLYPPQGSWPWTSDFVVCDNPISDAAAMTQAQLRFGIDFIQEQVKTSHKVLVCCEHGISRSATFVLGYLVESGYDLHDAWVLLKRQYERASPAKALWESLVQHYQLPYSIEDIYGWYGRP